MTRYVIRLKHPLPADTEINVVLPATLEEFDETLARGLYADLALRERAGEQVKEEGK